MKLGSRCAPVKPDTVSDVLYWAVSIYLVAAFLIVPLRHLDHYAWNYDEGPQLQAASLANAEFVLYSDVVLNKPPLLTWYLQTAMRMFGSYIWVARAAILLVNSLGFIALGSLAKLWWGKWAGIAAMVLILLPAELTVRAAVVMNDLPANSLTLFSLWTATRFRLTCAPIWLALSGIACAATVLIHPLLLSLVVPLMMILVYPRRSELDGEWLGLAASRVLVFGVAAVGVLAVVMSQVDLSSFRHWVLDFNVVAIDPSLVRTNSVPDT